MKTVALALLLLGSQMPKNNPNGLWEATTGSQFQMQLVGSDLRVRLVPGTNPRFLSYELTLKNQEEVNTYKGPGHFVAKLSNGKECRFETEWTVVVVYDDRIIGSAANIIPDPETCAVKERSEVQLDLKKKQ
jgi:hypothetical protein